MGGKPGCSLAVTVSVTGWPGSVRQTSTSSSSPGCTTAQAHHYAVAKGATVVSVTSMGPFAMTYVNPADDPQTAERP